MNNERRKRIAALIEKLEDIREQLDDIQGEEQEAFDNMPESLQQSDRGQQSEQAADALCEAVSAIDDILSDQLAMAAE